MATTQANPTKNIGTDAAAAAESDSHINKIDPNALAGSENSLGAESIRDGRPAACDDVVEAMDEEGPGVTAALAAEKGSS